MKPCCVDNCSECDPVPFRWGLEEERRVPSSQKSFGDCMVHMVHVVHICHFLSRCRGHYPCQYPLSLKDTSQRTHHSVCCISFMCFLDLNMTFVSNPPSYRIVSIGGCIFSAVHMIRTIKHSMKESIYVIEYLFLPMSFMSSCLSLFSSLFIFRLSGKDPQHSKSARLGKAGP